MTETPENELRRLRVQIARARVDRNYYQERADALSLELGQSRRDMDALRESWAQRYRDVVELIVSDPFEAADQARLVLAELEGAPDGPDVEAALALPGRKGDDDVS